jgi:mannosylglycoprotein endo-beta-mannosidase
VRLLNAKYRAQELFSSSQVACSPFWHSIQRIRDAFKLEANFFPGRNSKLRFWKDLWVGDSPMCLTFPDLFDKCSTPELPICQALTVEGWNIQFRRNLNPDEAQQWNELLVLVQDLRLQEVPDRVSWRLEPSGRFSTRSLYQALCNGPKLPLTKLIWNPRIPLKIKIFTWLSCRGRLPSNNLIRARGPRMETMPYVVYLSR